MTVSSQSSSDRAEAVRPEAVRPGAGRPGRAPISTTVLHTQWLTPTMVRVVVGGPGLAGFAINEYSDAYVKLVFLRPGSSTRARST